MNLVINEYTNKIENWDEILKYIEGSELTENFVDELKTIKNAMSSRNFQDKDKLEDIINKKIIEFEMSLSENNKNKEAIELLQSANEDFKKLGIIATEPDKNDSNKYIDYITFTHENGEVEVLACDNKNTLNDFIKANLDSIGTMKAEDVFRYFKEYIHRDLRFDNVANYETNKEYTNKPVVDDDEIVKIEKEKIENYRKTYSIPGEVEVSIDQNGERIYRIANGLFKFNTIDGERVMQTLKPPVLDNQLEQSDVTDLTVEETKIDNKDIVQYRSDSDVTSLDNIPLIDETSFDENDFTYITSKRDIYEMELSEEEIYRLNCYLKFLIMKMDECVQNKRPTDRYVELITDYLESPSGDTPSVISRYDESLPLSNLETELVDKYLENKNKIAELGLNKNKKLELFDNHKDNYGISTVIVILEIMILVYVVMILFSIDI